MGRIFRRRGPSSSGAATRPAFEGLIVLGAKINDRGQPGRIARMRLEHALDLWRQNGGQGYLILSGGCTRPGFPLSEARVMADYALARAEEQWGSEVRDQLKNWLLLEEGSLNTRESALNTLPLLRERHLSLVGLVSDPLHLRRAHFLFRRHFRQQPVTLIPLAVPGIFRHYWQNRRYLWLTKILCREAAAWVKLLLASRLRP